MLTEAVALGLLVLVATATAVVGASGRRQPAPGPPHRAGLEPAAPWRRPVARLVDVVLVYGAGLAALGAAQRGANLEDAQWREPAGLLVLLAAATFYEVAFVAVRGWTPGKWLLGLRVVGADGNDPGWAGAWLRLAALSPAMVGAPVCAFGLLRTDGRWGHDGVADTHVVPRDRAPVGPHGLAGPGARFGVGDVITAVFAGVWLSVLGGLLAAALGVDADVAVFSLIAPSQTVGSLVTVWALSVRKGTGSFAADFGLAVRPANAPFLLLGPALSIGVGIFFSPLLLLVGDD